MDLKNMNNHQLIEWIKSLPEDVAFNSNVKNKIIFGIKAYEQKHSDRVTGEDFDYAEDADDMMGLAPGIDKKMAKIMLKRIEMKQDQEFRRKKKERADLKNDEKHNDNNSSNYSFTLSIQAMRGKMYKIKNVTKHTKISTVRWKFLNELGANASAKSEYGGNLNKIKSGEGKIEIKKNGINMEDDKTLGSYGIVNGLHLPLVVIFKIRGGGGPGPNLNNKVIKKEWASNPNPNRMHKRGLNIEFRYKGMKVIGQIGYTINNQDFPKDVFEAHNISHIRKAICPNINEHCPNCQSILRYWFNECEVLFDGELADGNTVYQTQKFGNAPHYFEGDPANYANLKMTVKPLSQ